jgi:hypothetical protein
MYSRGKESNKHLLFSHFDRSDKSGLRWRIYDMSGRSLQASGLRFIATQVTLELEMIKGRCSDS